MFRFLKAPPIPGKPDFLSVQAGQTVRLDRDLNEIAIATYIEDPGQVVMGNHGFPPPE